MQRRDKSLMAAGLAAALALTLSGCGTSAVGESKDVTLQLMAADYGHSEATSSEHYWDDVVRAFEARNPDIEVEVDVYDWQDIDAELRRRVEAGRAPDLAQAGAYADYAAEGKLYSTEEVLSVSTEADFSASLAEAGQYHRVQYGMPFGASTRRFFYNKKLFERAGISGPPRTWNELRDDARRLKAAGVQTPIALPLGPEEAPAEAMIWSLTGGGGYTDGIGKYRFDSDANIKTFRWLKDELVTDDLTGDGHEPARLDRRDAFSAFARGEVGMLNGHPSLGRQAKANGVDYGTADLPGRDGPSESTLGVSDWMMAFKQDGKQDSNQDNKQDIKQVETGEKTAQQEATGKFLDFVYGEKNVLKFSADYGLLPVTVSASDAMLEDDKYKSLHGFLEQLPAAEFYPAGNTSWPRISRMIKERIGKAVDPKGSPETVLSDIQNTAAMMENSV